MLWIRDPFYYELVPGKEPVPPRIRISTCPLHYKVLIFVRADETAIGEEIRIGTAVALRDDQAA
jgi:hypothetical protein